MPENSDSCVIQLHKGSHLPDFNFYNIFFISNSTSRKLIDFKRLYVPCSRILIATFKNDEFMIYNLFSQQANKQDIRQALSEFETLTELLKPRWLYKHNLILSIQKCTIKT